MNIVYDARHITAPYTGLGRYSGSLIEALLRTHDHPSINLTVLLQNSLDWESNPYFPAIEQAAQAGRCVIKYIDCPPISIRQQVAVSRWLNRHRPDHYFYPHFDAPLLTGVRTTFVVHDLIPLKIDLYIQRMVFLKKKYFKEIIRLNLMRRRTCFTASRATRDDMLSIYPARYCVDIHPCHLGVSRKANEQDQQPLINGAYLLYVGDRRPHKNLRYTIDVFKRLVSDHAYEGKLVIVGTPVNHDFDIERYTADYPNIFIMGNVTDQVLDQLYRFAQALVLLSQYEGFGLPVVEAGKWGRKIVVSDRGSLPEIAPPGSCVIPLEKSTSEAANLMASYLASDVRSDSVYVEQAYAWDNAAKTIFPYAYQA
ncbi:glycosyltransferase family 1 protein [Aquabacterium sp.]|uniref:glycosyltransferase family 4 protein n=1 Tax=Aquabacterium sp. TaxID=1872578 RepID=UPI0024881EAA|nr:glycosyltransferase family 1 protein [Aquabacterium sp.]MDI1259397.1 glycosyltransferase family 1 protein [Aquabacterium sp.]